jgi:hypothetical protein
MKDHIRVKDTAIRGEMVAPSQTRERDPPPGSEHSLRILSNHLSKHTTTGLSRQETSQRDVKDGVRALVAVKMRPQPAVAEFDPDGA